MNFIFYRPDVLRADFYPTLPTVLDSSFVVVQDTSGAVNFSVNDNDTSLIISSSGIKIICTKNPLRFSFYTSNNELLLSEPAFGGISFDGQQRTANFVLRPDEHFYGTGERGTSIDKRGQAFESYNTPSFGYTTPVPVMGANIPFLATDRGFGIYFDNTYRGWFDLGYSDPDKFSYSVFGGELTYYLIAAPDIPGELEKYTWLTGRQPLPPRWSLGYIQSKYGYHNESEAEGIVQRLKTDEIPCDAIILDLYWFKNMGDLSWDLSNWPAPVKMMNDFLSKGIKTIAISEPYITSKSFNYSDAENNGYFAKNQNGTTKLFSDWWSCGCTASLIDMTNPSAQAWLWSKYQLFMDSTMAGLWTDLGEPERDDSLMQFYAGSDRKVHNIYDMLWAKTLFEGFNNFRPGQRMFNLTRAGFAGIQRYGVSIWSGDVGQSFGGLAVQLPIMLSMGMSGIAYQTSDMGGALPEIYIRWLEFGAFCPVMRTHALLQPSEPWKFDTATEAIVRKYIQLRYRLFPYNYTMAYENYQTGMPLARPLFFYYPNDNNFINESSSYMWGDDFLVSPVVSGGETSKSIYLPEGNWIDYWSDKIYSGGQSYTVPAPLYTLPLFVKEGSIIPMQPLMQYSDESPLDTLYLEVYPSINKQSEYNLYEDDGKTTAYQSGSFAQTQFISSVTASGSGMKLTFSLGPSMGNYSGKPQHRIYIIDFHLISAKPSSVSLNSSELIGDSSYSDLLKSYSGYYYNNESNNLYVQVSTVPDSLYSVIVNDIVLSVEDKTSQLTKRFELSQNYPNPFNPQTTIEYSLPKAGYVTLKIYDILGRAVATLVNAHQNAGSHKIVFDAAKYTSGVYFYRLQAGSFVQTKKLLLLK